MNFFQELSMGAIRIGESISIHVAIEILIYSLAIRFFIHSRFLVQDFESFHIKMGRKEKKIYKNDDLRTRYISY